jgi:hypothetical protein
MINIETVAGSSPGLMIGESTGLISRESAGLMIGVSDIPDRGIKSIVGEITSGVSLDEDVLNIVLLY